MHNLVIISICTECFGKCNVTECCCTGWWLFHSHLCIYTVHYWLVLYCTPHRNSLEKQQTVLPSMYVIVLNKALQWLTLPNKGISVSWVFCMPLSSNSSTFPVCVCVCVCVCSLWTWSMNLRLLIQTLSVVLVLDIKTQLYKMDDLGPRY